MKKQGVDFGSLPKLAISLCTFQLCCGAAAHAAEGNVKQFHPFTASKAERQAWRDANRGPIVTPGFPVAPGESADPTKGQRVNSPYLHHHNHNFLPGQNSVFQINRPSNRSTFTNELGQTRALHNGVSLDLASTNVTITVGKNLLGDSTVSLDVGGTQKQISAGSQVTAAEYAALNQKLATGNQGLTLNDGGAATDGSLNINLVSDDGRTIRTSQLVIPESVEVSGDFARHADGVRVTNDLINYGSLYASSSDRNQNNAAIAARDISNNAGGLISTQGGNLNLALRADRDLNNAGDVYASGDLELSAGGSLTNSGSASARGSVALNSSTVNNTGLISSRRGDINITSATNSDLNVSAAGGTFQARRGDINLATTPGDIVKTDTLVDGGTYLSNNLNLSSGDGAISGRAEGVSGMINASGGSFSFHTDGDGILGNIDVTGDPLFSAAGDLLIGANIVTGGAPLALIAGGNISLAGGVTTIDTSLAAGNGGNILIVAGAAFAPFVAPAPLEITGGTAAGGNVNLTGLTTFRSGVGTTLDAGNIEIYAFAGPGKGSVTTPAGVGIFTDASVTNGNITILGGATTGAAVNVGVPNTSVGTAAKGGLITIAAATPTIIGGKVVIETTAGPTQGQVLSGSFGIGALTGGSVTVNGNITTDGAAVSVSGGGDVKVGTVTTSGQQAPDGGSITIASGAAGTLTAGSLNANGANAGGNAGNVTVTAGTGGITTLGAISARAGALATSVGNGGIVDVTVFRNGAFFAANTINANGGGLSGNGGQITYKNIGNGGITFAAAKTFTVDVAAGGGDGGTIIIDGTAGATDGQIRFNTPVDLNANASTAGGFNNGTITIMGSSISFEGAKGTHKLTVLNGAAGTGSINLQTTGGAIFSTLGNSVDFNTNGTLNIDTSTDQFNTSSGTTAGGAISLNAGIINAAGENFSSASGLAGGAGGAVTITSTNGAIALGNITTSGFTTGAGGKVTVDSFEDLTVGNIASVGGASGAGGDVSLTAKAAAAFKLGSVTTSGGTGATSVAGKIDITNNGKGPITLGGNLTANSSGADGGEIDIFNNDLVNGSIELTGDVVISATGATGANGFVGIVGSNINTNGKNLIINNNGAAATGDVIIKALGATGSILTNGGNLSVTAKVDLIVDLVGTSINTKSAAVDGAGGSVIFNSTAGLVDLNGANIDTSGNAANGNGGNVVLASGPAGSVDVGSINAFGVGTGTDGDVSITSGTGAVLTAGSIIGGKLTLNLNKGPVTLTTDVNSLTTGSFGQTITINNSDDIQIDAQSVDSLTVNAAGNITTGAASNNFNTLILDAETGKSITISHALTALPNGTITLISDDGDITQTAAGVITTSGTGGLTVVLDGATPGKALLNTATNAVHRLTTNGTNTASVSLTNGNTAIDLVDIGTNHSLTLTTTNTSGVTVVIGNLTTSGTLTFNTPRYASDKNVQAASIDIQNLAGNLTVEGTSATLTGTTPPAGPAGSPSSPTAINIKTASNADLTLIGTMFFNGDVTMDNTLGTTTSKAGSLFTGNNNITLTTGFWQQDGTPPQIVAKNFILNLAPGGTIINTSGDVTFSTNTTINGSDFAIIAKGDVNLNSLTIDLSNNAGDAGNLTILAGYEFTPDSKGQKQTAAPFTFLSANPLGGDINAATLTINVSATGVGNNAGNVLAVAQNGSITLGNIDATSVFGKGGNVDLYGQTGVTVGDVTNTGVTGTPRIDLFVGTATVTGTPVVTNGTISGGSFVPNTATKGNITAGKLNGGTGLLFLSTDNSTNSVKVASVSANQIFINALGSDVTLTASSAINAVASASGDGGELNLFVNNIIPQAAPLTLNADSGAGGNGGVIFYNRGATSAITLGTDMKLSAKGDKNGGQIIFSSGGDITTNAGGLDATGKAGNGARFNLGATGTLNLTNSAFTSQANATVSGSGGQLTFSGNKITFASTSTTPLMLSANGVGNGSGGMIQISTQDTKAISVGVPAKASKSPTDFLELSANAGAGGGDGGQLQIQTNGDLFVDTAKTSAKAAGVNQDGSRFIFRAGSNATPAELIINGSLNADALGTGSAGFIDLRSASKTVFNIDSNKVPKNGVFGQLSAVGGDITVLNVLGDVSAETSNGLKAATITLQAQNNGDITSNKGVVITATKSLTLLSDTGTIGKSGLLVNTPTLSVNTQDIVGVTNQAAISTLLDSTGLKKFELTTAGAVTLNNITVDGDIKVTGGTGGSLTVADGKTITANNGEIELINPDTTNGSILIGVGSTVQTAQAKGQEVTIAIGKAGKGTVTTAPAGVTVNKTGKGDAFFDGAAGGVVKIGAGPNAVVNALEKDVNFFNGSTNAAVNKITLSDSSVVTADPPADLPGGSSTAMAFALTAPMLPAITTMTGSAPLVVPQTTSDVSAIAAQPAVQTTAPSVVVTPAAMTQTVASLTQTVSSTAGATMAAPSAMPAMDVQLNLGNATMPQVDSTVTSLMNRTNAAPTSTAVLSSPNLQGLVTVTENEMTRASGLTGPLMLAIAAEEARNIEPSNLIVNAAFLSEVDAGMTEFATDRVAVNMTGDAKNYALNSGSIVFAPKADTTIATKHGTVKLAADSVALVMESANGLAVYNLYDKRKNAVVVQLDDRQVSLAPGRHVLVSSHRSEQFADVNAVELVLHRGMNRAKLNNGWNVFTSEFSIPSACYAVKPLRNLTTSKHKEAIKIREKMIKTTAVIMTLNPDRGDFVQHFKTQITAMK